MVYKNSVRLFAVIGLVSFLLNAAHASPQVFSGAGTSDATNALNAFRAAIGGVNNGGNPPPQFGGRREINWDGVKLDGTDFNGNTTVIDLNHTVGIPVNRFQARGVIFQEVYAVSGDGFASVNPGTAGHFPAFSPNNTFAMFNENTIELNFVLASAPTTKPVQAGTRGFGAIFLDVNTPNTSKITYYHNSTVIGEYYVPSSSTQGDVEFLGVLFDNPLVTRVELTLGTATLFSFDGHTVTPGGPENLPSKDLAVVDDFVYAEPASLAMNSDFNGDGHPDLLLQNAYTGQLATWFLNGTTVEGAAFITPRQDPNWRCVGDADFNADGHPDILFQNRNTGQLALWLMNGTTATGGLVLPQTPPAGWNVVSINDFNGDGYPDLLLQNQYTGQLAVWLMNGTTVTNGVLLSPTPPAGFRVVGSGDFDGDGQPDIVFQNPNTGRLAVWYLNGTTVTNGAFITPTQALGWNCVAVLDLNNDGHPDLVFQNASTGQLAYWLLNGTTAIDGNVFTPTPPSGWQVVGLH